MLPKVTKESLENIIDSLEDRFPNSIPKSKTTQEDIHILIGQQSVIRYLKEFLEAQYG
jgi:hypothetical protein